MKNYNNLKEILEFLFKNTNDIYTFKMHICDDKNNCYTEIQTTVDSFEVISDKDDIENKITKIIYDIHQ